jgi:hypothetical protein
LLLRKVEPYYADGKRYVQIVRNGSWWKLRSKGSRILRLYSDSGQYPQPLYATCTHYSLCIPAIECSDDTGLPLPISFATLPEHESPTRFALLRAWLDWCDKSHNCNTREVERKPTLPTRLLYVEDRDPEVLRLYCPKKNGTVEYVALSHRWGEDPPTNKDPQFCTTDMNIEARRKRFRFSELPKTFQDAIHVTRKLGIPYVLDRLALHKSVERQ